MYLLQQTLISRCLQMVIPALGLLLLQAAQSASAQLLLNESVIEMDANQARGSIQMSNTGSTPIQVSIDLQEVLAPGTFGPLDEVTIPVQPSILQIEPNHFELPPNDKVTVAIHHSVRALQDDEAYRLLIQPTTTSQHSGMNILLNYDLMLLVRPADSEPKVRLIKTHEGVAFENQGTTNALLTKLQVCDESKNVCQSLPSQRLYAEQHWPIVLPEEFDIHHTQIKTHQRQRGQYKSIDYRIPVDFASK